MQKPVADTYSSKQWRQVIKGCIANSRKDQEKLYRHFFPIMERMVRRYTQDEDQLISIMNNGFLKVFKKIHTYEHRGSFEGWMRKLIYHSLSDYFRSNAKDLRFLVFDDIERDKVTQANHGLHYDDLMKFIEKLPEKHMKVFHLYAIEGYKHREIAVQMDISENTSKWYLSEARKILQKQITNHFGEYYNGAG